MQPSRISSQKGLLGLACVLLFKDGRKRTSFKSRCTLISLSQCAPTLLGVLVNFVRLSNNLDPDQLIRPKTVL